MKDDFTVSQSFVFKVASDFIKTNNNIIYVVDNLKDLLRQEYNLKSLIGEKNVCVFLPLDNVDKNCPASDFTLKNRISFLYNCVFNDSNKVIITNPAAILHKVLPKDVLSNAILNIKKGATQNTIYEIEKKLLQMGYIKKDISYTSGTFSIRGDIMDVVIDDSECYRIDFFDTEIENIRLFDKENLRTIKEVNEFNVRLCDEFFYNHDMLEVFKHNFSQLGYAKTLDYEFITEKMENAPSYKYINLFYKKMDCFFDYIPSDSVFYSQVSLLTNIEECLKNCTNEDIFLTLKDVKERLDLYSLI